jgi:hypothetical protein
MPFSPSHEAIAYRRVWSVFRQAILPATAASERMPDAADHASLVHPVLAAHISRKAGFDLLPLIVVEPGEIGANRLLRIDIRESTTDSDRNRLIGF